jgi:hypothetical protein
LPAATLKDEPSNDLDGKPCVRWKTRCLNSRLHHGHQPRPLVSDRIATYTLAAEGDVE